MDCFVASAPLRKHVVFVADNDVRGCRFAPRNDGERYSLAALALLHARIERVARGVADQVDAEDRDREQQSRPEDQRRFDLKIGAALGHDVAPGRRLRADAGAEKRQDRLGENGGGAHIGALNDQGGNGVRHQMPPHDLGQAGADGGRGLAIRLAPDSETTAMASRMLGIAINPSMTRIMTASIHLKKPETRPITRPTAMLTMAAPSPISSEIRPP